jgi:DNA-binding transcriptional MocR family regulator
VRLPEPLDATALAGIAAREGVTYSPGSYFAVSRTDAAAFRLSFAGLPPASIEAGLGILGRVFKEELDRARAARPFGLAPAIV